MDELFTSGQVAKLERQVYDLRCALIDIHEVIHPHLPHKKLLAGVAAIDDIVHRALGSECS
jgi:hypothetical protein